MKIVDIVVPVMNEEEVLPLFYKELKAELLRAKEYDFRIIFVDDGSSDNTFEVITKLSHEDKSIKYISFSRNFGKESAIYAGLTHAYGDYIILMDGDLEHPPALIHDMLMAVETEGFEACGAKRHSGIMSQSFATINNRMSTVHIQKGATDYMCMTKKYLDAVLKLTETQRFSKGLFAWVGFNIKWIDYSQPVRPKGKSKWNIFKLFDYATEGLTSFSTRPLRFVTLLGVLICFCAFIYIIVTLINTFVTGIEVPGYVTTLVFILFLGGIIILSIGILGEYIGRIYLESKERPIYIAKDTNIDETDRDKR